MKKLLIVLVFLLVGCQSEYSVVDEEFDLSGNEGITEYYINAKLISDDELRVKTLISYYNDSADVDDLKLNFYANAYDDADVKIKSFKINGETHRKSLKGTVLSVDLDQTLLVGESIDIEIEYEFDYWGIDRLLRIGDDYVTMFFYPFVAYYEDGWQTDEFSFNGETYYNDIGNYYVNLQLPNEFVLATGGEILSTEVLEESTIYEVELLNGRDYSFSFSADYEINTREIEGVQVSIATMDDVTDEKRDHIFDLTESVIIWMEEKVGDYPYPTLTLEFGRIYGMESSTIIYCDREMNDITIVHELMHQWFYGIIGNDQATYPWLDEGVTTYMTGMYFTQNDPDLAITYWNIYNSDAGNKKAAREANAGISAIFPTLLYDENYGFIVYVYGASVLRNFMDTELEGNQEAMLEGFKIYYDNYAFKEADLAGLFDSLEEAGGRENTSGWFYTRLNRVQILQD